MAAFVNAYPINSAAEQLHSTHMRAQQRRALPSLERGQLQAAARRPRRSAVNRLSQDAIDDLVLRWWKHLSLIEVRTGNAPPTVALVSSLVPKAPHRVYAAVPKNSIAHRELTGSRTTKLSVAEVLFRFTTGGQVLVGDEVSHCAEACGVPTVARHRLMWFTPAGRLIQEDEEYRDATQCWHQPPCYGPHPNQSVRAPEHAWPFATRAR